MFKGTDEKKVKGHHIHTHTKKKYVKLVVEQKRLSSKPGKNINKRALYMFVCFFLLMWNVKEFQ
jgi:hypothetical protein